MVRLSKIYTKKGDDGSTGLGNGARVPKHSARVAAYGTVDELNAVLGLLLTEGEVRGRLRDGLSRIQNELFDVGSDLCVPGEAGAKLRIGAAYTTRLERWIDEANQRLEPLNSFILPGGSRASAWLHLARTVARRAEREVTLLVAEEEADAVNPEVVRYLNRLSDLFFVLGRLANDDGKNDVLWAPGATDTSAPE